MLSNHNQQNYATIAKYGAKTLHLRIPKTENRRMEIGSAIRQIRKERGITTSDLAIATESDQGGISRIERNMQEPKSGLLKKIADALSVSVVDIYVLAGEEKPVAQALKAKVIPLISSVQAGSFCEAIDNFAPGDAEEWLPCPVNVGRRSYALKVTGSSMTSPFPAERSYPEGCLIFVDPDREHMNGSKVIAKLPDSNEVTFKKYVEDGGKTFLQPINPQFQAIEIDQETHICGVVVGSFWPE